MPKRKEINLSKLIYRKLRVLITSGHLVPGQKIIELAILKKVGSSRTPFREAIKALEAKGFVETIHNKGIYVRKMSVGDFEKIYDLLAVLEGYAAKLAASRITEKQIGALERANDKLKELHDLGLHKNYAENNAKFHLLFPHFCRDQYLESMIQETRERVHRYRLPGIAMGGHVRDFLSEHEAIILSMKKRSPEKAEENMKLHIQRTKSILVNFIRDLLT